MGAGSLLTNAGVSTSPAERRVMPGSLAVPAVIRTPDHRLRVFVSSTLGELRDERAAVRAAIERLRLAAVMFEFGARPHPPRALYRAYLDQSQIFVGIYSENYGWVAPDMGVSGIEDEYDLAAGKPCLVYVKEPAPKREQRLEALLERVRDEGRVSYKCFETAEQLDDLVADDLALLLAEQFEAAGHQFSGREPGALRMRPLPVPPTALVGREEEIEAVRALMGQTDVRLLTLSGIGGIGKTRLAVAAVAQIASRFADGVGFVDLSAVRSAELVPGTVAAAIGVSPEGTRPLIDSLHERLADAEALLVLDNFEHVIAAAPFVVELLTSCPGLKVIVTSRALLRVRGEHELQVMPLQTPTHAVLSDQAMLAPAIRLFAERARDRMPGFAIDRRNAEAVVEVCRRLEGIPLAIELAASRVRVLPPQALLGRIGERLDVLTGPTDLPERQHTLRATIDWSYELLDPEQRTPFARLSVFAGGFTLEGAEAVCGGKDCHVLEVVSSLIENSLVAPVEAPDVEPRFRMLEVVREYAQQRLQESGNDDAAYRRMAQYFAQFVKRAAAGLVASENRVWLQRMDQEVNNVRAVATWAIEHGEFDLAQEVLVPPWIYWWTRGYFAELRPVAEHVLSIDPAFEPVNRARLLLAAASCRFMTGDNESAMPLLEELLEIQRARGDEHELAIAQTVYCAANPIRAAANARGVLEGAAATLRGLGDRWGAAFALVTLGQLALRDGDVSEADRIQHEALEHAQAVESEHMVGIALNQLGFVALAQGNLDLARSRLAQSAELNQHVRDREGLAYSLDGLAAVALAQHKPELAAKAIGTADAIRQTIGVSPWPIMRAVRDPLIARIRVSLSDDAFAAAHIAGTDTAPDDAIEELLSPGAVA